MVWPAVLIGVLLVWLSAGRVQYTWRISWLAVAFVAVCVSSMAAGGRLAGWVAGGLFELLRGIAGLISAI